MLEAQGIAPSDPSLMDSTASTRRISKKRKAKVIEEEEGKPIVKTEDEAAVSHLHKIPACADTKDLGCVR